MSERDLVSAILETWGGHPQLRLWRSNTGAAKLNGRLVRFGVVGAADLSGILSGGRRLEIECKTDTGKQSPAQLAYADMIVKFGGLYILARDISDVSRALQSVGVSAI